MASGSKCLHWLTVNDIQHRVEDLEILKCNFWCSYLTLDYQKTEYGIQNSSTGKKTYREVIAGHLSGSTVPFYITFYIVIRNTPMFQLFHMTNLDMSSLINIQDLLILF